MELLAAFVAIVELARRVRRSHGPWYIDNMAALRALVRGRSGVPSMEQMAKTIHLGSFSLETQAYYNMWNPRLIGRTRPAEKRGQLSSQEGVYHPALGSIDAAAEATEHRYCWSFCLPLGNVGC